MLNFLTGFLSLSGGAIFAQAVYFLFVKYPSELCRLDIDLVECDSRFGWEMKEEDLALDLLKDFAEHHLALFRDWANLEDPAIRQKHKIRLAEDIWRVKPIDGAENLALSRAAQISGEALVGMHGLLSEARVMTEDDLAIAKAQSGSVLESFGAALRLAKVLNNSRRTKLRKLQNEKADLNFLRSWARCGVFVYGLVAAEIADFKARTLAVQHPLLAGSAFLGIFSLTLLVLLGSFLRERKARRSKSELEKSLHAGGE
jgi:hypothetical protein